MEQRRLVDRVVGCFAVVILAFGFTTSPRALADGIPLEVNPGPAAGQVTLDWAGWQSSFTVFRSTDPANVTNQIAVTAANTLVDNPGLSGVFYYLVASTTAEPHPWNPTWQQTVGDPSLAGEQDPPCEAYGGGGPVMVGPVIVHSGEVVFTLGLPTSSIPGRGDEHWNMPLVYRSQIDFKSCVGNNWNLRYATDHLELVAGGHNRYLAERARFDFYDSVSQTAPGFFQVITPGASTTQIRERDGFTSTYLNSTGSPADGALVEVEDRNGNYLEFTHNGHGQLITAMDSMGRGIDYWYDSDGHLSAIRDFSLRTTLLDFSNDQLVAVTTPAVNGTPNDDDGIGANGPAGNDFPSGKTYEFRYDTANPDPLLRDNLLGITFPNESATGGPERYTFTYGLDPNKPLTYDRVVQMDVGGGLGTIDPTGGSIDVPAGGSWTFTYQDLVVRTPGNLTLPFRKTTVTDSNGNITEHVFNSNFHEISKTVQTNRGINPADPATFVTQKAWNLECLPDTIIDPQGNITAFGYDLVNVNRFSQGNLLQIANVPGARGGDQGTLITTYTYEPIYNLRRTITTPRGDDPIYIPPIPDNPSAVRSIDLNLDGDDNDPADGETTRRLRYTTLNTFDYQELAFADILALATAEGVDLDLDGGGVLTATDTAQALSLGGGAAVDQNGDGLFQESGNIIEILRPNVILPSLAVQNLITTITYNDNGQRTSDADPEGILTSYYYFPEADPDGNGNTVLQGLIRPANPQTGGYLMEVIRDDNPALAGLPARLVRNSFHPIVTQPILNSGAGRRTRPASFVETRTSYTYDLVGNVNGKTDGRGVETRYVRNQLNQVVEIKRAAANDVALTVPLEPGPLLNFKYLRRQSYDFNDNIIRVQVEDRGDTSNVGADNPGTPFIDTVYTYDLLDNLIRESAEVDNSLDLVTRYRYDPNGNRVLAIQPAGNAVSSFYDERDLLFENNRGATSPPPLVLLDPAESTSYNPRGGVTSTTTFTYDGNRNVIEEADAADTDAPGSANNSSITGTDRTRSIYDGYDRLTSRVDSVGNQSVIQYDPDGNVIRESQFGPVGGPSPTSDGPAPLLLPVSSLGTIQGGNLVMTTADLLAATEHAHDEIDRTYQDDLVLLINTIATIRVPDVADGATALGKGDLTPADNGAIPGVAGITIEGRVSTIREYDRNSLPVVRIEDDTDTSTFDYDGLDRIVLAIDPEANEIEYAYDDNDNVIETAETDVSQVGPVADEVFLTTYFYDALDRIVREVDNLGHATDSRYDSRDNLVASSDANGPVVATSISRRAFPSGLLTVDAINDFGNVTLYTYDGLGRRIREEKVLTATGTGDGINIGADDFGVKTTTPPPDTSQGGGDGLITIRTEYDPNSLIEFRIDDNGNQTEYVYDNLDRRILESKGTCVAPSLADQCHTATVITWDYDPDHNVTLETDENGSQSSYTYDAIDRKIDCTITPAATVVGTTLETFEYDGLSRLTRTTDDNDSGATDDTVTTHAYDSLSRVLEESLAIGPLGPRAVTSSWRADGLIKDLTYPNGRILDNTYDDLDRLKTVEDTGGGTPIVEYDYIGTRRVLQRQYPINGTRMTYLDNAASADIGYDGLRRTIEARNLVGSTVITGFEYTYDRLDNQLTETKLHDNTNNETYDYDGAYRLTDFDRPGPSSISPAQANWTLDGVGNWTQVDTETRQHSSFNEIIEQNDGAVIPIVSDDNGNITEDGDHVYQWDARDRLRTVTDKGSSLLVATYTYDGTGRRVRKVVTNSGALNGTTDFYYDGARVVEERDSSDILVQQYVHGLYVDELLVLDQNKDGDNSSIGGSDERFFYHQDRSYNVFALTDGAAVITEGYLYDAFGRQTVYAPGINTVVDFGGDDVVVPGGSSDVGNPYLFTGRRLDPEAGFYHYRNRYYDPLAGRFATRDPIGVWEDGLNMGNRYAYVGNSPRTRVDPLGLLNAEDALDVEGGGGIPDPGWDSRIPRTFVWNGARWVLKDDPGNPWSIVGDCAEVAAAYGGRAAKTTGKMLWSCVKADVEIAKAIDYGEGIRGRNPFKGIEWGSSEGTPADVAGAVGGPEYEEIVQNYCTIALVCDTVAAGATVYQAATQSPNLLKGSGFYNENKKTCDLVFKFCKEACKQAIDLLD